MQYPLNLECSDAYRPLNYLEKLDSFHFMYYVYITEIVVLKFLVSITYPSLSTSYVIMLIKRCPQNISLGTYDVLASVT